jgi:hypothetical protein
MNDAIVYTVTALFALIIFPVHVYNYLYLNTEIKYASINAGIYRINFFNANTVENNPGEMQINGKKKKIDPTKFSIDYYRLFNRLCIHKIVQLGDYGVRDDKKIYVFIVQNALTNAIYNFLKINGNHCKLKNYTVLNEEHSEIRYYAKAITILNIIVLIKIFSIIIMEKLNELKT